MRRYVWAPAIVHISLVVCAMPLPAEAHPGMNLGLNIRIDDEGVRYKVTMSNDLYTLFMPMNRDDLRLERDGDFFRLLDAVQEDRERQTIEAFFKDANPVTVDGLRVKPILGEMRFKVAVMPIYLVPDPRLPPDVEFTLIHPLKSPPKLVSMVWEAFAPDTRKAMEDPNARLEVWAELDAYDENRLAFFEPDEPEVIWHAPGKPVRQRVKAIVAESPQRKVAIPTVSVAFLVLWALVLTGFRFSSRWPQLRRRLLAVSIAPVLVAALCHNVLVAEVNAPWLKAATLPGDEEAREIFRSLHANIYRAFDYKSESDIYDVLAQSVDGPLLDQVYNEVYQSLIMREEGGAVARIQSVEILDAELDSAGVLPESGDAAFKIRCVWQVHGAVSHWGHVHERTNEYEAVYTVARRGGHWKITGVEVLQQERVVPETQGEEDEESEDDDASEEDELEESEDESDMNEDEGDDAIDEQEAPSDVDTDHASDE